jgi:hypothetical protein
MKEDNMFRFIKIAVFITMFFSANAFAEGWGRHHHYGYGGYGYGYGYNPYYGGGGYVPAPVAGYYPAPQQYYAPPPPPVAQPNYGYGQQMPMYGQYR